MMLTSLAKCLQSFTTLIPQQTHLNILLLPDATRISGIIATCVQNNSTFANISMITVN